MQKKLLKWVRLPTWFVPEHYELSITPDFSTFTFVGTEVLKYTLTKATRELVLHAKELTVKSAVVRSGTTETKATRITHNPKSETVHIQFAKPLKRGKSTLHLSFKGMLNDKMRGFYRSSYRVNGKDEYMAVTQFEATDARCAFPCVDEPDKKAVFDVTLTVPKTHTAISNTLPVATDTTGALKTVRFAPTPKMSTYLLAFIVGKMEYLETKSKDGTLVRVYTTPGKKDQAKFALTTCAEMLSFYNTYYGIPYPLAAMQLIAVPDFSAGAMENWGAVTYRESSLLIDEKNSSVGNKQRVAIVIAHELAHQWFGNLVTMNWWTHLWLNEGFASYMEYLAVDNLFPEWDIWTQFAVHDLGAALRLDALKTTHPIEVPVHHPDEISEIFDTVSYSKGASVIRMLATYLGEEQFRAGLHAYLTTHRYANATTEDLWRALGKVSKKPVATIMKFWTGKPGYPLVTIDENSRGVVTARQKRFYSSAKSIKTSSDRTVWPIPLAPGVLMNRKQVPLKNIVQGTKFNQGETAFVRVRYPRTWLDMFERHIEQGALPAIDRLGIIRDVFALAESGVSSTDDALRLVRGYRHELDYTVWANVAGNIGQVGGLLFGTPHYGAYENFARSMFAEIVRKVGWDRHPNEKHTDVLLRSLALGSFAGYGDRESIRSAKQRFTDSLTTKKEIDPDLRGMIYGVVGEYGGIADHQQFMKLYRATSSQQEKDRLSGALESFRNTDLLQATIEFAMGRDVRPQDAPFIIGGVGRNSYGRELMWNFVQKNWKEILKRYATGGHLLPAFIGPLGGFHEISRAREVEKFFIKNRAPGAERSVQQAIERIRSNADWLRRDEKKIAAFLDPFKPMQ